MRQQIYLVLILLLVMLVIGGIFMERAETLASSNQMMVEVTAENARLNRKVMDEVEGSVEGVPAEPVHSFVWDGDGSIPIDGHVKLEIDPVANTGEITAEWTDKHGQWKLRQTQFAPPDHASGLRIGPSASSTELVEGDPVTTNVYLHGDTTAGGPVLPTLFNLLATWGPAEVTLNGQPFENPFDGPAPLWATHTMTTIGVRHKDGTVTANNGENIYDPSLQSQGNTQPEDLEVHLVFHDASGPETDNFPPLFSFFYHLSFEDVEIKIEHTE